jgi:hypothetical protein
LNLLETELKISVKETTDPVEREVVCDGSASDVDELAYPQIPDFLFGQSSYSSISAEQITLLIRKSA